MGVRWDQLGLFLCVRPGQPRVPALREALPCFASPASSSPGAGGGLGLKVLLCDARTEAPSGTVACSLVEKEQTSDAMCSLPHLWLSPNRHFLSGWNGTYLSAEAGSPAGNTQEQTHFAFQRLRSLVSVCRAVAGCVDLHLVTPSSSADYFFNLEVLGLCVNEKGFPSLFSPMHLLLIPSLL